MVVDSRIDKFIRPLFSQLDQKQVKIVSEETAQYLLMELENYTIDRLTEKVPPFFFNAIKYVLLNLK